MPETADQQAADRGAADQDVFNGGANAVVGVLQRAKVVLEFLDAPEDGWYDTGSLCGLQATWLVNGSPTNPDTVLIEVQLPDGTTPDVYRYQTDPALETGGPGVFWINLPLTQPGTHRFKWEGTGAAQGAREGIFRVRESAFAT